MVVSNTLTRAVTLMASVFTVAVVLTARVAQAQTYTVSGKDIRKNGVNTVWVGTNALHQNGGTSADMTGWNIGIVREVVNAVNETPVGTGFVWGSNGTPLHGLQKIVNDNRANGKITILCPFAWNDGGAQFAGTDPRTDWPAPQWTAFQNKLKEWATQFKGQSDVWIETWNEPYGSDNDPDWYYDQKILVDAIRSTGNTNIIVVPGCNWGSSESVILSTGQALLNSQSNKNIVFDLHAYNWTWDWQGQNEARIQSVWNKNLALMIGEIGPGVGGGYVTNPAMVLNAALSKRVTTLTWYWNKRTGDPNALFDDNGNPNNTNNYNFYDMTRSFFDAFTANAKVVDGTYYLSPLCAPNSALEVPGWSNYNGAALKIWWNDGSQNKQWYVQRQSGNNYKVVSFAGTGWRVLDVSGASNVNGTTVQLWDDNTSNAQRWTMTNFGDGNYRLSPLCATGSSLDVEGASAADGTRVQIWQSHTGNAQRWTLKTHN